ncbi:tumor necrosis factor receptor superfamily member 11A isoform X2 [Bombina bombina]|uniref:tumor necrosis factor receptor superfamily member 11A isoform X2 n=1 Tax=Bombina bombina TaxID=8345 RepID=UPI00235A8CA9|nr:tumor necrosis factor receptor superfamily member 11A isoform X2 [Bombina bombina]
MSSWTLLLCLWIILVSAHYVLTDTFPDQNSVICDPEKQYQLSNRCCSKCEPGKRQSSKCTPTSDTVCSPCGPNEYMPDWNNEHSCSLHDICDPGKALRVAQQGNSTHARKCVCVSEYHWNQHDYCSKNKACNPGFGVERLAETDKDTVCAACRDGFFSNISSSTEQCKPWTNCTEIGLVQIKNGTKTSDPVCDKVINTSLNNHVFIIVGLVLLLVVSVIGVVCFVFWRKKLKELTENLQQWINELFYRSRGTKEKSPPDNLDIQVPIYDHSDTHELLHDNSPYYSSIHNISGQKTCTPSTMSTDLLEKECLKGRSFPTEDEYTDKMYSAKPLGIEVESNITETEYSSEESDSIPAYSEHYPLYCSTSQPGQIPLHTCGQSARTCQEKGRQKSVHSSQCTSNMDYSHSGHNVSDEDATEEMFSDSQSPSGSSNQDWSTSDTPPLSGNITGNTNSTFIANGQVMNFNGDVIFLVMSQNSQETATDNESNEGNVGNPVQEESQSRCDSFVPNTQSPTEKYADILSSSNMNTGLHYPNTDHNRCSVSPCTLNQGHYSNQNIVFIPVQEEGKPEYFSSESMCF